MKFLLTLFTILATSSLFAQEEISVSLKLKSFALGEVPAFVVFIPQADYQKVIKSWEKYLKDTSKEKPLEKQGEIWMPNASCEKIAAVPLQLYSYIKEYDGEIMLVVAMDLEGNYISKDMDEEVYLPAKKFVRDFAVEAYKEAVKDELKEEEKILKKMEGERNSLMNSKEALVLENNQYERNIIATKDAITLNQLDQSNKVVQLQAQKEFVLKLANAGEEEKEEASKVQKELEKDFKKLQKANESLYQDIDNYELAIRENDIKIAKLGAEIKYIQLDIEDQTYKVRKVGEKLEKIH
ncbi:MAG: hypothetical protein R2772_01685 [Chitinophagales bacterium]